MDHSSFKIVVSTRFIYAIKRRGPTNLQNTHTRADVLEAGPLFTFLGEVDFFFHTSPV